MDGSIRRATARADQRADGLMESLRRLGRLRRPVRLRAPDASERRVETRKPGLTPVGVARPLPPDVKQQGEWSVTPEGQRVWRLSLQSTGAESLRVRFTGFHAGSGLVWLFGPESDGTTAVGPYTGDGPFGDGTFWSDLTPGDTVTIAYQPDPGAVGDEVPFHVAEVSHRFGASVPQSSALSAGDPGEVSAKPAVSAASCAVDATCYAAYREPASAVALMIFESEGKSYNCSGSLISSAADPAVPFFLTANHCISTPEEARSLIAIFNYQTPTCDGTPPALSRLPRVTGATLVAGQPLATGDFRLLQLTGFPDVDVKVLGWSAELIGSAEPVVSISHPRGDFKRIAFGQRTRDVAIRFSDGARMPADVGYQVAWTQGITQGGSSGSPLLATLNGKQYLVGTLTAGPDIDENNSTLACRTSNLVASYGRFASAFSYLSSILAATSGPSPSGTVGSDLSGFTATPAIIPLDLGQAAGHTTLRWNVPGVARVQVRVQSPTGPPLTGVEPPSGSALTGDWVTDGMMFYLQNASSGDSSGAARTLATVRIQVTTAGTSATRGGTIVAAPNPIGVTTGQSMGSTTLRWQATGVTRVQVRVGSPAGPAVTGFENPAGAAPTGNWVTDGMTFYLQDASDGYSAGAYRTLSSVRVQVVRR